MRQCMATGKKISKWDLIRFVLDKDTGVVSVDVRGKKPGRGANLSPTVEAFDLMIKKKALKRVLKLENDLNKEQYEKLREDFLQAIKEKEFRPLKNKPVRIRVKNKDLKKSKIGQI